MVEKMTILYSIYKDTYKLTSKYWFGLTKILNW
jgi:hypothetical protein